MAHSPRHIDVITPSGVTRVRVRYVRNFQQTVSVRFCFLYRSGIEHACDDWGCWPDEGATGG